MRLTELALRRAGAADLEEFQRREGLYPSGQEDILTMQRLTPLLLGYERYMVKPGDTYYRIATARGTSVRAMLTANPNQNPNLLIPRGRAGEAECEFVCARLLPACGVVQIEVRPRQIRLPAARERNFREACRDALRCLILLAARPDGPRDEVDAVRVHHWHEPQRCAPPELLGIHAEDAPLRRHSIGVLLQKQQQDRRRDPLIRMVAGVIERTARPLPDAQGCDGPAPRRPGNAFL